MSETPEMNFESGTRKKTLCAYLWGFSLCVLLTLLSFALVQWQLLAGITLYLALAGLALTQLLVQVICFLGLNVSKEGQWNLLPFLFTLLIIIILAGGSLWIMYNLNYNMH